MFPNTNPHINIDSGPEVLFQDLLAMKFVDDDDDDDDGCWFWNK